MKPFWANVHSSWTDTNYEYTGEVDERGFSKHIKTSEHKNKEEQLLILEMYSNEKGDTMVVMDPDDGQIRPLNLNDGRYNHNITAITCPTCEEPVENSERGHICKYDKLYTNKGK